MQTKKKLGLGNLPELPHPDDLEMDALVQRIESGFENTKVIKKVREIYDDTGKNKEGKYDIFIISPIFNGHGYEERINMIWPLLVKLTDRTFKKIWLVECLTPAEYTHK